MTSTKTQVSTERINPSKARVSGNRCNITDHNIYIIFASNSSKLRYSFRLFFLTDVSIYYEERKMKLLINFYIKISRNLDSNFEI